MIFKKKKKRIYLDFPCGPVTEESVRKLAEEWRERKQKAIEAIEKLKEEREHAKD